MQGICRRERRGKRDLQKKELNTLKACGKKGGWASLIALCYIWKILVIILHFIMGSPAKPEDHKKSWKQVFLSVSLDWGIRAGKCFTKWKNKFGFGFSLSCFLKTPHTIVFDHVTLCKRTCSTATLCFCDLNFEKFGGIHEREKLRIWMGMGIMLWRELQSSQFRARSTQFICKLYYSRMQPYRRFGNKALPYLWAPILFIPPAHLPHNTFWSHY